jgi:hypothetical protein
MGTSVPLPELPVPLPWMSEEESKKAWMTVRDGDLLERLLVAHAARLDAPADVLEWGAGRSTLYYSDVLERRGLLGSWLALEHNRDFFTREIGPQLTSRPTVSYVLHEDAGGEALAPGDGAAVRAVIFDAGDLQPYDPERLEDRRADLDDYVALPASLGRRFDIVIVDGRKRRRCLLEASSLLSERGIAVLHDAWRPYYHCAFEAFAFARRIGDELWVGAQRDPDLAAILPEHAFGEHFEDG